MSYRDLVVFAFGTIVGIAIAHTAVEEESPQVYTDSKRGVVCYGTKHGLSCVYDPEVIQQQVNAGEWK